MHDLQVVTAVFCTSWGYCWPCRLRSKVNQICDKILCQIILMIQISLLRSRKMLHISQWCIFRVKLSCWQNFGPNHQWLNVYFMHWAPSNELFSLQCSYSKRLKAGEPNNWDEPGNMVIQQLRKTPYPFFSSSVDDQIWQYNSLF